MLVYNLKPISEPAVSTGEESFRLPIATGGVAPGAASWCVDLKAAGRGPQCTSGDGFVPHFEITGPHEERTWNFPDDEVFVIGRARSCALQLADTLRRVSRQHAAVVRVPGSARFEYFIRDLGSRESTRINCNQIHQHPISDGTIIEIAEYKLRFCLKRESGSQGPRVRVVRSSGEDIPGSETKAAFPGRQKAAAEHEAQELLEQYTRHKNLNGSPSSLLREFSYRIFRYLHASRGFVARIISAENLEYEALEVFAIHSDQELVVEQEDWLSRILKGEIVVEATQNRNTIVIPITGHDPDGFFFLERSAESGVFSSAEINFLVEIAGITSEAWARSEPDGHTPARSDVDAWPVDLVGCSSAMKELRSQISVAAKAKQNTLVLGETGTGKEVVARALCALACGSLAPKIEVACAALPESLAETELFGKEKGAFTGADRTTKGLFESANGGAILLDDIQQLPNSVRQKLYRVILEKRISRVGSAQNLSIDVFILGTVETRPDQSHDFQIAFLERFPQRLQVPPLRQRPEDIPLLAFSFLDACAARESKRTRSISHRALEILMNYEWPGNVRELKTCIENAVRQDVEVILSSDLPPQVTSFQRSRPLECTGGCNGGQRPPLRTLAEIEKEAIEATLMEKLGNVAQASRSLGISEQGLRDKMKRYDIRPGYGRTQS